MRVGVVGCGRIAEQHLTQIARIAGAEVVGTCDMEDLMAKQLAERFGIPFACNDIDLLLEQRPDVVHITTPPQSHYGLAIRCLSAGCHVYVEKPFTIDAGEAEELLDFARKKRLRIIAGHNYQFTREMLAMRKLVSEGFLGGPPIHLESYYSYSLADPVYAAAFLGNREHWVHRLPGKLLQNLLTHGLGKIAEFFANEDGDDPEMLCRGFTSPRAKQASGGGDIIDELRVTILTKGGATAYFTLSTGIGPPLHLFRVHGPRNSIVVDCRHRTMLPIRDRKYRSYLNYFLPPLHLSKDAFGNALNNIWSFLRFDFHDDSGLKAIIEAFYRCIEDEDLPSPISDQEILWTARTMDRVFQAVSSESSVNRHALQGSEAL